MHAWGRLWRRIAGSGGLERARELERAGDLAGASAAFERAGELDEALRVAEIAIGATADAKERVRLLASATALAERARVDASRLRLRYARARLDVARATSGALLLTGELREIAEELLALDDPAGAAEAFRAAGDHEGEARALMAAGSVEELEAALEGANARAREERVRGLRLAQAEALEAGGQRVRALAAAREVLGASPADPSAKRLVTRIEARLVRAPSVSLEVRGERATWSVAPEVILGRSDAAIVVASPLVSRSHLRIFRGAEGGPFVEDLKTRNGTLLAGARLGGAVPVSSPMSLKLGAELTVELTPLEGGAVEVRVGDQRVRAALGPARVGPWTLREDGGGLRLTPDPGGSPPIVGEGLAAAEGVDLCVGDEIRELRDRPVVVRVFA